jgi:hypothetical protein
MFSMDLGNLSSILSRVDMQILYNFTQNIQAPCSPANQKALSVALANESKADRPSITMSQ